jgi:hypothetical protein
MIPITLDKMRTYYSIAVPVEKAHALFTMTPSLLDKLTPIEGVEDVNYDGHFGPVVYIAIHADFDTPYTRGYICEIISTCLEQLK